MSIEWSISFFVSLAIIFGMLNINTDNITESYEEIRIRTKDDKSFAVTGLTSLLRIFLLSKISSYSKKKVLFITSTEQNALKY